MHSTSCDIYACRNAALVSPTDVELTLSDGEVLKPELCDEHRAFFAHTSPDKIAIGRAFTGEIEVRNIPAQPVPPRNPASTHTPEDNS